MEEQFQIKTIGRVNKEENRFSIEIFRKFIPGLKGIEGFSHLQILWWGHLTDTPEHRDSLVFHKLFKKGPDNTGTFATRATSRPNPISVSTIKVDHVDEDNGLIHTPFIDAETDTPVLDVKPYYPMERVKEPITPKWCEHWPGWYEDSIDFNWAEEINFSD